jgi:hypothetical protein
MSESPERASLQVLATTLQKALNALKKTMAQEHSPKRDKKIYRIMAEVELVNDEAMRKGLNFSNGYIAKLKTGRISAQQITPSQSSSNGNAHRDLMKYHFEHVKGPIADGAAQGAAIKWLLEHYAVDVLKKCYEYQLTESWRGKVSWISVKSNIGGWLARNGQDIPTRALSASERNEQQLIRNIESVGQLRRSGSSGSN